MNAVIVNGDKVYRYNELLQGYSIIKDGSESKGRGYYSIKEIMQITGFSRSTVMRTLKDKRLNSTKVEGLRNIRITDFEKYMEGNE